MEKIKICVDARVLQFESNGISRYLRESVYELSKFNDLEIYLISNRRILIEKELLPSNVILIEDMDKTLIPGTVWLHLFMNNHLEKICPDIYWGPNQILPFRKKNNIKYLMAAHDLVHMLYPETMTFLNKMIFNLSYSTSVKHADKILTISETTKLDFLKYNGSQYSDKVKNIYLGGAENFKKNKFFSEKEEKSIFILGSLEPRKNINYFLDVFEKSLEIDSDIKLYITGAEKWKSKDIRDRIRSEKFKNNVFLLGYLTDKEIENYFNKCKLFVFPSLYEGFGLPLIEAQGKILILASKIPVFEELSKNFENLYFLDFEKTLFENANQLIELLGNNSISSLRRDYFDIFTWKYTAQEIYDTIIELISNNKGE